MVLNSHTFACSRLLKLPSLMDSRLLSLFFNIGTENLVGNQVKLSVTQMMVSRIGGEPWIFDRLSDGEVV